LTDDLAARLEEALWAALPEHHPLVEARRAGPVRRAGDVAGLAVHARLDLEWSEMAEATDVRREEVIAEVYDEYIASGKLRDPADGIGDDDDAEFWQEVERRLAG
jgi:hypothetical protein